MIYIVHGEDLAYSRNIILNQQKKLGGTTRTEVSITDISPAQLLDLATSFDMFGTPPFIVFDVTEAGKKNLDNYVEILEKVPSETTLIILAGKTLPVSNALLKNADRINAKIVKNEKKPTSNIFRFIETVYSGNRNASYKELRNLILEDQDPFYLFSMILYGARKHSSNMGEEKTKSLFRNLYKLDKDVKTGLIAPEMLIPTAIEKVLYAGV